ncbi:MAG TPA: TIGR03016 family PEP-CTERM system-associated outer membrane protein [Nitrospirota bacterium]|nr:TIGR03016 family PEP-CTERM system-associated outer membrane protein [Nitrospirota bacterium]
MARTRRTRNLTIIMVVSLRPVFWFLIGLALSFTVWPGDAVSADIKALPSIAVSEEYNDNVFLTRYNKVDDYITSVIPAFTLDYKTPLWTWHLDLAYDFRYYAKRSETGDSTILANLNNHTELVKNLFFIDILDTFTRASLDTARDWTTESTFVNVTRENIFTFNPYLVMRSESRYTPILGYKYVNTWYKDPTAIGTVDNIGYAEMITDLSSKVTFTTGVRFTQDTNDVQNYDQTVVYAGPKYTYAQNSFVYLLIGESFLNWTSGVPTGIFTYQCCYTTNHVIWDTGITHRYSTVTVAYQMKSDYIHDPTRVLRREDLYVGTVSKTDPRTTYQVSVGYYEYRNAQTNHLENTTYGLTGFLTHVLSPTLTFHIVESIERLEDYTVSPYTVISLWHTGVSFDRIIRPDLTLNLEYEFTNSYCPENYSDNYINNRFIVGLSKRF